VVSSFFADIFRNNCLNVGVLPVQVSAEFADKIQSYRNKSRDGIEVNLPEQTITLKVTGEKNLLIFPDTKANMINGLMILTTYKT
jgi:3-isopropylmalate/(R)-2-methylmalate dehydratase small subunit